MTISQIPVRCLRLDVLATLLFTVLGFISCDDVQDYSYDQQRDVDASGWRVSDTLWYELEACEEPGFSRTVLAGHEYQLGLSVRHTSTYSYWHLPLRLMVQHLDTVGCVHPIPVAEDDSLRQWTFCDYSILPQLAADSSHWQGAGWGSLCQMEYHVTGAQLLFPEPGFYRIGLLQQSPDTLLTGVVSVGLSLW